jgi:hypothetical protein
VVIFELLTWSFDCYKEVRLFLEAATLKAKELLMYLRNSSEEEWEFRRVMLPSKSSMSGRSVWSSGGSMSEKWPATFWPPKIHFHTGRLYRGQIRPSSDVLHVELPKIVFPIFMYSSV